MKNLINVFASENKALSRRSIHQLIAFTRPYLCKNGFSNYAATETKYRNILNLVPGFIIQLSSIKPNTKIICEEEGKTTLCIENCKYVSY
jgi:hypothetical protein